MAQVYFGQSDLRKALLAIATPAAGVTHVSEMLSINFQKLITNKNIPTFLTNIIGLVIQDCEDIFVKIPLQKYFDNQPPFELKEVLLTGSWSEGLVLHGGAGLNLPDMDFMCILNNISFSEEDQACGNLTTVKEDTAFVNAYITNQESLEMWEDFLEDPAKDTRKRRLSSSKLKTKLHYSYKKMGIFFAFEDCEKCEDIGDGPSLEVSKEQIDLDFDYSNIWSIHVGMIRKLISSSDIVLAIGCDGWPRSASEWLERHRLWPDKTLVQTICQEGFHIVPKSSPEGDFRLSFSKAEVTLVGNLTPLQHKVIRAFKAVIKFNQSSWSPKIKDIICSYHLKTIAFWHVEKYTQDSWTEDNVVSHLLSLLDEFAQALRKGNLPMYFLPKYNLLKNDGNRAEEMKHISHKASELARDIPAITKAVKEEIHYKNIFDKLQTQLLSITHAMLWMDIDDNEKEKEQNDKTVVQDDLTDDNLDVFMTTETYAVRNLSDVVQDDLEFAKNISHFRKVDEEKLSEMFISLD